jgi:hypothetical protein
MGRVSRTLVRAAAVAAVVVAVGAPGAVRAATPSASSSPSCNALISTDSVGTAVGKAARVDGAAKLDPQAASTGGVQATCSWNGGAVDLDVFGPSGPLAAQWAAKDMYESIGSNLGAAGVSGFHPATDASFRPEANDDKLIVLSGKYVLVINNRLSSKAGGTKKADVTLANRVIENVDRWWNRSVKSETTGNSAGATVTFSGAMTGPLTKSEGGCVAAAAGTTAIIVNGLVDTAPVMLTINTTVPAKSTFTFGPGVSSNPPGSNASVTLFRTSTSTGWGANVISGSGTFTNTDGKSFAIDAVLPQGGAAGSGTSSVTVKGTFTFPKCP